MQDLLLHVRLLDHKVQGGSGLGAQQANGDGGDRGGSAPGQRDPHQGEKRSRLTGVHTQGGSYGTEFNNFANHHHHNNNLISRAFNLCLTLTSQMNIDSNQINKQMDKTL